MKNLNLHQARKENVILCLKESFPVDFTVRKTIPTTETEINV
jgi:hypothetical protein